MTIQHQITLHGLDDRDAAREAIAVAPHGSTMWLFAPIPRDQPSTEADTAALRHVRAPAVNQADTVRGSGPPPGLRRDAASWLSCKVRIWVSSVTQTWSSGYASRHT